MDIEEGVHGLEAGADLCFQDPFRARGFTARMNALIRRVYPHGQL